MELHLIPPPQYDGEKLCFFIKVKPAAKQSKVGDFDEHHLLKVDLAAPPVDGKANKALVAFLAKQFGVKQNCVHILSGETGRIKRLQIDSPTNIPPQFKL